MYANILIKIFSGPLSILSQKLIMWLHLSTQSTPYQLWDWSFLLKVLQTSISISPVF